jgi:alpha-L-fucosidase
VGRCRRRSLLLRGKHGGYYTTEYDNVHDEDASKKKFDHPWDECRGIGGSFGYNRNESLADYETSDALIHMLIQKVARGGNLLLDIGPAADGTIPVIMQQRLSDLGAWLAANGEAIYGTTAGPQAGVSPDKGVFVTQKGKDIYLILTTAADGPIQVALAHAPAKVTLLGSNKGLGYTFKKGNCVLKQVSVYPNLPSGGYTWVVKLENAL